MISTTRTLYELTPQVSYLRDTTTSVSILNLLPLLSTVFLYFFCLGYVTRTTNNPSELYLKVMLLSVWGTLKLNGFEAHPGHVMDRGMDPTHFSKFIKCFQGHYHMKSSKAILITLVTPISCIGMTMDVKEDSTSSILKVLGQLSTGTLLTFFIVTLL